MAGAIGQCVVTGVFGRPFLPLFPAAKRLMALAGLLAGCESNHDLLAEKPTDASVAVDVGRIEDVSKDERGLPTVDADAETPPEDVAIEISPPEPPGPWALTWTNGLSDVPEARFCFFPVVGGREIRDGIAPLPAGGLGFGKSVVFTKLSGVDWSMAELHPYVVVSGRLDGGTGDGGESCRALIEAGDAAPPDGASSTGPFALPLPTIPAGTLGEGRSYLGVATGCARHWPSGPVDAGADGDAAGDPILPADADEGGPIDASEEHDVRDGGLGDASNGLDAADGEASDAQGSDVFVPPSREICGATRLPGLMLVQLARRDTGEAFGVQAVHASQATSSTRMTLEPAAGGAPVFSADVALGQIAPRSNPTVVAPADLGPNLGAATVRVAGANGTFTVSLGTALATSDLSEASLSPGSTFSLVLLGARSGQEPGPLWNAARVVVVRNAP